MVTQMTADGMAAVSQRFADGVANVKNFRKRLQGQMDVLATRWGGQASGTFQKVMQDWGAQHDIIVAQLQDIADKLHTTGVKTQQVETQANQNSIFFHG